MKKFKQFFDEYKALHTPQRDVDEDPTSKQSAQAKQLILRNNLKYNKETGCYDAQGNVRVKNEDLINGALPLQLGEVAGSMVFELCNDLQTLKGCPRKVGKGFSVYSCTKLKSLQFGPDEVGWYYDCSFCKLLKNLIGAPKYIGQRLHCSYCSNLQSLNGLGQIGQGKVYCEECPKLRISDEDREHYKIIEKVK